MSSTKLSKCIKDWEGMIQDAKARILKLQTVISVCEENKKKGEPWPGVTKSSNTQLAHYRTISLARSTAA